MLVYIYYTMYNSLNKQTNILYKAKIMDNSILFKQAHAMTKQVIKTGDNYSVTFGLCLKAIKSKPSKRAALVTKVHAIDWQLISFCSIMLVGLALFVCGILAINQMNERNKQSFEALYSEPVQDNSHNDFMAELQAIADKDQNDGITVHYTK